MLDGVENGILELNGMSKKINTIIVPIIQSDYLPRMLETLHKYTQTGTFDVIVIDQTTNREAQDRCEKLATIWVRPYRNLGFAKAMNTGIRLAQTKFVTLANDDIEFIDDRWWQGILDTFASDPHILGVNPMSPKEQGWGYGLTQENDASWQPPKGFARIPDDREGIVPITKTGISFPIKDEYTKEEYDFLLNDHPIWGKDSMCDALTAWCTIFRTEDLIGTNPQIGLLDERFYPGGGEDYDMNARAYSCAYPHERTECDPDYHRRLVGSARSWVLHHWSKSRKFNPENPIFSRPRWNANEELWKPVFDVWAHYEEDGKKWPIHRVAPITIEDY